MKKYLFLTESFAVQQKLTHYKSDLLQNFFRSQKAKNI